jgi:hypothetical protein
VFETVLAEWLGRHGDLTDRLIRRGWEEARREAISEAELSLWRRYEAGGHSGLCAHGASAGACHIIDCINQYRAPVHKAPTGGGVVGWGFPSMTDNWRDDNRRR